MVVNNGGITTRKEYILNLVKEYCELLRELIRSAKCCNLQDFFEGFYDVYGYEISDIFTHNGAFELGKFFGETETILKYNTHYAIIDFMRLYNGDHDCTIFDIEYMFDFDFTDEELKSMEGVLSGGTT